MNPTTQFTSVTPTLIGEQLSALTPEILLLATTLIFLLTDVFKSKDSRPAPQWLAVIAIVPTILAIISQMGNPTVYAFSGMYVGDELAHLLKLCTCIAVMVSFIYAPEYLAQRDIKPGEFYMLGLFALLGMLVMISANNLLVVYVGLELLSLSMYAMAALRRDSVQATEAAMKYFVLGALASGFLLYGMSMVYGGTGTLEIPAIAKALSTNSAANLTAAFGVVFVVGGLAFKFGAVPFHMWVPDVYDGTPSAVTLLIAGAPKLAAFAIAFRMLVEGLSSIAADWQTMLMMLAVLSIVIGNLVAIAQTSFKRMLAYSTISHVGFILLGLMSGVVAGDRSNMADAYSASTFYVITYVLMTLGTFGILMALTRKGFECDQIDDLKGLWKREPWLAFVMLLLMFSMAGIPPLVGFYAKLIILSAVIKAGYLWVAIIAVLFSLVGAFYYLRIVKVMIFDDNPTALPVQIEPAAKATLAVNGFLIVALGLLPTGLVEMCSRAIRAALGS